MRRLAVGLTIACLTVAGAGCGITRQTHADTPNVGLVVPRTTTSPSSTSTTTGR